MMHPNLHRHIFKRLKAWQLSKKRKPLLLMGARQVGKTHILQQFGESCYEDFVYLNFEDNPTLKSLFKQSLSPIAILEAIAIEMETVILPGKTLIIFDEIQECPEALNSLKYFNEFANAYHICAAGSLLGVTLTKTKGFPVGKVNFMHLYPFSFFEFLQAIEENALLDFILKIDTLKPLPANLHVKLDRLFNYYLFTGGMPEAIIEYIESKDFSQVNTVHQNILQAYQLDFSKHAPKNSIMKIIQVWQAIPAQLAKENKKFIYSVIRQGARAKEFEEAIQWLKEAGLIHKVTLISTPKLPLNAYANFEHFKIYLNDVGLLGKMSDLSPKAIIHNAALFQEFQGALIENYATQALSATHEALFYWASQHKAEIDFVLQLDNNVYPLEIKSGTSRKKQSMRIYNEKYQPKLQIRCSPQNLTLDNHFLNCPLYLIERLSDFVAIA